MTRLNIYDLDKLTDSERELFGLQILRKRSKERAQKKCTDCKKIVANPISSYKLREFEFISDGEHLHQKCLNRRMRLILQKLKGE